MQAFEILGQVADHEAFKFSYVFDSQLYAHLTVAQAQLE